VLTRLNQRLKDTQSTRNPVWTLVSPVCNVLVAAMLLWSGLGTRSTVWVTLLLVWLVLVTAWLVVNVAAVVMERRRRSSMSDHASA
jgi:hypothetical protein